MQDFELIIEPPVEAEARASAAASPIPVVAASASFVTPGRVLRASAAPGRASAAPVRASLSAAVVRASLAASGAPVVGEDAARAIVAMVGPRVSLSPSLVAAQVAASPVVASSALVAARRSSAPDVASSLAPVPRGSGAAPAPARAVRTARPRELTPNRVLASYAPPPPARLSWTPAGKTRAERRADLLARLGEDLLPPRLVAVVPRTHAGAVLAALGPLDRGLIDTVRGLLALYAEVRAPHLIQVACGLAELASHTGRGQAAFEVYRALYAATGDPDFELRAADAVVDTG